MGSWMSQAIKTFIGSPSHPRARTIPIPIIIFDFLIFKNFPIDNFNDLAKLHPHFKGLNFHINTKPFTQGM